MTIAPTAETQHWIARTWRALHVGGASSFALRVARHIPEAWGAWQARKALVAGTGALVLAKLASPLLFLEILYALRLMYRAAHGTCTADPAETRYWHAALSVWAGIVDASRPAKGQDAITVHHEVDAEPRRTFLTVNLSDLAAVAFDRLCVFCLFKLGVAYLTLSALSFGEDAALPAAALLGISLTGGLLNGAVSAYAVCHIARTTRAYCRQPTSTASSKAHVASACM